jgi:hypothetical protein
MFQNSIRIQLSSVNSDKIAQFKDKKQKIDLNVIISFIQE